MSTERDLMRIVIVGHVDHGKSTLVGRLFHDTGSLPDGKLEQIKAMCERRGMPFEWAFLMDAFQSERDQGITIDTSQIWFKTPKRDYTIIDAPGHREFIKNMITGASSAEAAIMLIDASEGVQQQSRTHAFLLNLLGIRQIVVVVNKMDLVGGDEKTFQAIKAEYVRYLEEIGIVPNFVIPAVARDGDNLVHRSERMGWYDDATLIAGARFVPEPGRPGGAAAAPADPGCLQVRRPAHPGRTDRQRAPQGRRPAAVLALQQGGARQEHRSLECRGCRARRGRASPSASPPTSRSSSSAARSRATRTQPPIETNVFRGRLFWLGRKPLMRGDELSAADADARRAGDRRGDRGDLRSRRAGRSTRPTRSSATRSPTWCCAPTPCWRSTKRTRMPRTGRFVLGDGANIVAGGTISMRGYPDQRKPVTVRSRPTSRRWRTASPIRSASRATATPAACCGLPACPAAGKSTIAMAVEQELFRRGYQTYVLDGDNVRRGLNSNLELLAGGSRGEHPARRRSGGACSPIRG